MFDSTDILGVRVACVDKRNLLGMVRGWIQDRGKRTLTYVNAYCLNVSSGDRAYREILNATDLVYADGMGAVWAGETLGGCRLHKLTGADWIDDFCQVARDEGWKLYILAGKPGVARKARSSLENRFPSIVFAGESDGYFREKSESKVLEELVKTAPDVLFVGMGAPVQEKWVARNHPRIPVSVCWSVGALFDYVAGEEPRAPSWMRRLSLEWLWRMLVDPLGKWKRYLMGNPLFVFRVLRQRWVGKDEEKVARMQADK